MTPRLRHLATTAGRAALAGLLAVAQVLACLGPSACPTCAAAPAGPTCCCSGKGGGGCGCCKAHPTSHKARSGGCPRCAAAADDASPLTAVLDAIPCGCHRPDQATGPADPQDVPAAEALLIPSPPARAAAPRLALAEGQRVPPPVPPPRS
jgi:hypothetical protein